MATPLSVNSPATSHATLKTVTTAQSITLGNDVTFALISASAVCLAYGNTSVTATTNDFTIPANTLYIGNTGPIFDSIGIISASGAATCWTWPLSKN